VQAANCPHADGACSRVLSLPLHPALDGQAVAAVAETMRSWSLP
jgi:dTDP-4-amino-4,6-dideoxygalactose transaminase